MRAAAATRTDADDPLRGLTVADVAEEARPGWVCVQVRAAALNHHDLWTLRGQTRTFGHPPVLGTDAAGIGPDGTRVVVHAVVDPGSLLSESAPGALAERVHVPLENLVRIPDSLSFEDAACLPTSYLTAYNMLFGRARLTPGEHVLVQGAGGGVSTAAIALAVQAGLEVTVASRSAQRAERALTIGAHHAVEVGARLPAQVDAVLETVGAATWRHSLRSVRRGGRVVVAGATSGFNPPSDLAALFLRDVDVIGTYMGSVEQLRLLVSLLAITGVRPVIDSVTDLAHIRSAAERLLEGDTFGKVVIRP